MYPSAVFHACVPRVNESDSALIFLLEGAKGLGKKYRGSTLEALLENPKIVGTELGYEGISALMRLFGLFQLGGSVREGIASLNVNKKK